MAKTILHSGNIREDAPPGENITRISYDVEEPPKNYIWGKQDGCYYTWNGCDWVLLNSGIHSCNCPDSASNPYISEEELQKYLNRYKLDIISYIKSYVKATKYSDGTINSIISGINDRIANLRSDITADRNNFATKTELQDAIAGAGADVINDVKKDIQKKEKVTAAALNDLNSRINELSNSNSTLIPEFRELESETLNIKNNLDEIEEVVAESLNDLNSRIRPFENNSHITTLEVREV